MSGIGEYVHYRFSNYQKFGTAYNRDHSSISAGAALGQARAQLKSMIGRKANAIQTKKIETFLNSLIYGSSDATIGNISMSADNIAAHRQYFTQLIQAEMPRLGAILDSVGLENVGTLGSVKGLTKIATKDENKVGVTSATVGKAQNALKKIVLDFESQRSAFTVGGADFNQLSDLIDEANDLYQYLGQLEASFKGKVIKFDQTVTTKKGEALTADELFRRYNNIIKLASQPTMKDYGDIAEIYFQYMLNAAAQATQSGVDELLSPLKTAGQRNVATVGLSGVSSLVDVDALVTRLDKGNTKKIKSLGRWTAESNGYNVDISQKGSTSLQTTDIIINFKDNSNLAQSFGLNQLKASVKNVKGFKNIAILKDAPLSSAFALFDTNFVNHYLNLLASHPDSDSAGASMREKYNETVKIGLALRALQGRRDVNNTIGVDLANCFIVNKRGYGIKIIDTQTLMTNVYHNLNNYISAKKMPSVIHQSWVGYKSRPDQGKAYTRIAKLLAATNAVKLTLTLKNMS